MLEKYIPQVVFFRSSSFMLSIWCVFFAFGLAPTFANAAPQAKALFYNPNTGTSSGVISGNVVQAPGGGSGGDFVAASGNSGNGTGQAYTGISNYYDRLDNPGMHFWIELSRPGSGAIQRVNDQRVFRTGERIRIHLSANTSGKLLANHTGSSGREKTFPVSLEAGNGVEMGKQYVIPSASGWLRFDQNKGVELIRLVLVPGKPNSSARPYQPASVEQVNQLFENFSHSKSLIETVVDGEKDLVVEGVAANYSAALKINRKTSKTQRVVTQTVSQTYNDPGRYVVNTAGEPVAMEIRLRHQ